MATAPEETKQQKIVFVNEYMNNGTFPPAYDDAIGTNGAPMNKQEMMTAWGAEYPPPSNAVWMTPGSEGCKNGCTDEKDPKILGFPAVETTTKPHQFMFNNCKFSKKDCSGTEVKSTKRCHKILIALVVLKTLIIIGLVVGLVVGLKHLKHKSNDDDNDECGRDKCSGNGKCFTIELGSAFKMTMCDCFSGYGGSNCASKIDNKCNDKCVYGTCEQVYSPSSSSVQPTTSTQKPKKPCSSTPNPAPAVPPYQPDANNYVYQCVCNPEYTGQYCDTPIGSSSGDPCSGVTCSNNGKCMSFSSLFNSKPKHRPDDNENSNEDDYMGPNFPPTNTNQNYMCLCNSGYEGVNCEFPSGSNHV